MVNSPTTGQTANHMDTVGICVFLVDFLDGVLVLADDDGWLIDPEDKNLIKVGQFLEGISFKGDIIGWVVAVVDNVFHAILLCC